MYGYVEAENNNSKDYGKFGLNQNVMVKTFEYNPNGGKNNTPLECIDFAVTIGDAEYRTRFFPIAKVYSKNVELTDKNSQEYKDALKAAENMLSSTLCSIVKCFVPIEVLTKALSVNFPDFKTYATTLEKLMKVGKFNTVPVDVFLQYQFSVAPGKTKTYLELPKNVRQGIFITKAQEGNFVENRTSEGIKYLNENNVEHPISRGKWFVSSSYANRINLESNETSSLGADSDLPFGDSNSGSEWDNL